MNKMGLHLITGLIVALLCKVSFASTILQFQVDTENSVFYESGYFDSNQAPFREVIDPRTSRLSGSITMELTRPKQGIWWYQDFEMELNFEFLDETHAYSDGLHAQLSGSRNLANEIVGNLILPDGFARLRHHSIEGSFDGETLHINGAIPLWAFSQNNSEYTLSASLVPLPSSVMLFLNGIFSIVIYKNRMQKST